MEYYSFFYVIYIFIINTDSVLVLFLLGTFILFYFFLFYSILLYITTM